MTIVVKVDAADALKHLNGVANAVPEIFRKVIIKYTLLIQRDVVSNTPVDVGFLSANIHPSVEGLVGTITPIGEAKKYAPFVEYDTRPHWPPIKAIEGWASRHNIPAYLVARSISLHGTKGHHMFENALKNLNTEALKSDLLDAIKGVSR